MIEKKILAMIPARGGSKRIPRKNIKDFLGKPMIAYSIEGAIKSNCFAEVIVSTDDQEIADVALEFGAKVPFFRSDENSDDYAMLADVVREVLEKFKKEGIYYEYFCCILATAPFISSKLIKEAVDKFFSEDVDGLVPVVRFDYPIQRSLKIEDDRLSMIWPENYNKRSNDLMPAYHDAGQFYIMKTSAFFDQVVLFPKNCLAYELPASVVQDIDSEEDWEVAELKYKILNNV